MVDTCTAIKQIEVDNFTGAEADRGDGLTAIDAGSVDTYTGTEANILWHILAAITKRT